MTDELHVREGRVYHFELESRDVLHSFSVPVFRLKQDAIPGFIKGFCTPNALSTLMEYLVDYASPAIREAGEKAVSAELERMPQTLGNPMGGS